MGDSVITTLSANLQSTAYNTLGTEEGLLLPWSLTGKILVEMVPNRTLTPISIEENWNSWSVIRQTQSVEIEPPRDSILRIYLQSGDSLDYFRKTRSSLDGYSYVCEGSITREDHTIQVYNGQSMDRRIFTGLCQLFNCAFAQMGPIWREFSEKTAEESAFNKSFPFFLQKKGTFSLNGKSGILLCRPPSVRETPWYPPAHMAQ